MMTDEPTPEPTPEDLAAKAAEVAKAMAKLNSKGLPPRGPSAPEEPSPLKAEYERLKGSKGLPPQKPGERPSYDTTTVDRAEVMKEIRHLIRERGSLFYFAETVVEIVDAPLPGTFLDKAKEKPAWMVQPKPLNAEAATAHIEAVARWFRPNADGVEVPKPLPDWSRAMLAKTGQEQFPALKAIIRHPVVKGHARIVGRSGYDPTTGLYIDAEIEEADIDPVVRALPLKGALDWLLTEWLAEVPFDTPADGLRALMVPMTQLLAKTELAQKGKWPMFVISAPDAGTGKSELAHSLVEAVTGREIGDTPWPASEEEMGKNLTAISLADQDVVVWDNLPNGSAIISPQFDAHVTSSVWNARILGVSKQANVAAQTLHVVTGNNVTPHGDTHRRTVTVRLVDHKGGATGRMFDRPSLRLWTKENRASILWCLLRLAAAKADRPGLTGNFNEWQRRVAAPLMELSGDGTLLDHWKERAPSFEGGAVGAFLSALREKALSFHHGKNEPLSASHLLMLLPDETADLFGIAPEVMAVITAIRIKDAPATASDEEKAETRLRQEVVEKARTRAMAKAAGTVALRAEKHKDKSADGMRLRLGKMTLANRKPGVSFLAEDLPGKNGG
jgi:hypothetical protein